MKEIKNKHRNKKDSMDLDAFVEAMLCTTSILQS